MFVIPDSKMVLYSNEDIIKFILDFFRVRKGVRCRTRFNGRAMPFYYEDYGDNLEDYRFNLVTIDEKNIIPELRYGLSHFLRHIYDKDVLTEAEKEVDILLKEHGIDRNNKEKRRPIVYRVMHSHYMGITEVIDIDSPRINNETTERMNFFDDKVIEYFNETTRLCARELDENGEEYNCLFSNNGFYFITKSYYPDEYEGRNHSSLFAYKNRMKELCKDVDNFLYRKNIPIEIKQKIEGWSRFNKMPFAFGDRRISIPISKEHIGNINKKWLEEHTNPSNLIKFNRESGYELNNEYISEIIRMCKWEKLW